MARRFGNIAIEKMANDEKSRRQELRRCLGLLARFQYCDERATAADNRFRIRPGTLTGDRDDALAHRWSAKAEAAWDEAIAIIRRQSED